MSDAVLAEGLTVQRGSARLLDGVSLRLARGDFLAVLGPNGAGKTTLLQTIPALIACTGGLTVLGQRIDRLSALERNALRRRIGYVPQLQTRPSPVLPLSVREVAELGCLDRTDRAARVESALDETGLAALADRPYHVLSGGEQRKVHLARALAGEPELLLLDEPAGHLDLRWQEWITQWLGRRWRRGGLTVVMVTHDLRHLPAGITRVALLRAGRLLREGPPAATLQPDILSDLFGWPLRVLEADGRYHAIPEASA